MTQKRQLRVYVDQWCFDVLRLDAFLADTPLSARLRELLEAHAKDLQALQPKSLLEIREQVEYAQ